MSLVADEIRRLDTQLDKIQLLGASATLSSPIALSSLEVGNDAYAHRSQNSRQSRLQAIVRALSTSSTSKLLLSSRNLTNILKQFQSLQRQEVEVAVEPRNQQEAQELEWLVVGKATLQTYGLILSALLEQILPLSEDLWYWDEVLGSYTYTGLYTLQTSPLRAWKQAKDVYQDVKNQFRSRSSNEEFGTRSSRTLGDKWGEFYKLVRKSVQDRSVAQARAHILSPFALCRTEARQKRNGLMRLREMNASALGLLMEEGLSFELDNGDETAPSAKGHESPGRDEWRTMLPKSIALMETVLRNVTTLEVGTHEFEETVFATVEDDPETRVNRQSGEKPDVQPAVLVDRLQRILKDHLPVQLSSSKQLSNEYGRPPRLVRYWIPAAALLLSSSTILRIFANHRTEIINSIRDAGTTAWDFWMNWVVEPVKKLIGTIRHDENSEVAIMSKRSLEADRDSLERMVVDFAVDNPTEGSKNSLTETDIADIRLKVKEGDLTPVLKAYERDLRSPFMGSIRGELIRALLIQIQKTKVDVEVAIGGIDALLKSQELVFGFVSLTPGILVSLAVFRYLGGVFGNRKGLRRNRSQGEIVRTLRNIDRILNAAAPNANGMLSYKEHGLLLCEVHVLRQKASSVLPGEIHHEFLEEVGDLADIRTGVLRQQKVVDRIRWAYAKWLQ